MRTLGQETARSACPATGAQAAQVFGLEVIVLLMLFAFSVPGRRIDAV